MKITQPLNKFFACPNCLGIYEMVPIVEISALCRKCYWKRPKVKLCRMGINQYTKIKRCRVWKYIAGGKSKRRQVKW